MEDIDVTAVFGAIAMCLSLTLTFVGLTAQVRKNYQRKSCEGLSLILLVTVLLAYLSWSVYGFSKPDWFLVGSQTPAVIFSIVLLGQYVKYHRGKGESDAG